MRLINCFDIVDHKRPIDLSGSSVTDMKPKRTLGSRIGKHFSPVGPLALKSVGRYLIACHACHQHVNALFLLVLNVLNMSFKQSFALTVTKTIKNSYRKSFEKPIKVKLTLILKNLEDVVMNRTTSIMKE